MNMDGSIEYAWVKHLCPGGTLWDEKISTCNHQAVVVCPGRVKTVSCMSTVCFLADSCVGSPGCVSLDFYIECFTVFVGTLFQFIFLNLSLHFEFRL